MCNNIEFPLKFDSWIQVPNDDKEKEIFLHCINNAISSLVCAARLSKDNFEETNANLLELASILTCFYEEGI